MSGDQLDLDAIEARAEAAAEGPWRPLSDGPDGNWIGGVDNMAPVVSGHVGTRSDALFIANAREDVPALVAEVRRLREVVASLYTSLGRT